MPTVPSSRDTVETPLVVQWLKLCVSNSGRMPGRVTRSLMPQLKIPRAAVKIGDFAAATKTWCS